MIAEWSGAEQAAFQAVLDGFTKKTGATITYTSGGDNTSVLVNSRVAGGDPPDVALIAQPGAVVAARREEPDLPADRRRGHRRRRPTSRRRLAEARHAERQAVRRLLQGRQQVRRLVPTRPTSRTPACSRRPTWDDFVTASKTLADSGVAGDGDPGR